jgi:AbiV family abortive infection protein
VPKQSLQPEVLAEGALRALEQAFRLADDAFLLFEKERWPTAVVLALFAREELGRYDLLAEAVRDTKAGKSVSASSIAKRCEDHVEKLRRGYVTTTIRLAETDAASWEAFFKDPGTPESKTFRERLDRMHQAKAKRQHEDAHKMRLRALYVELSPSGKWVLPSDVSREDAEVEVRAAAADCANTVARFWSESPVLPLLRAAGISPSFKMPLAIGQRSVNAARGA